MYLINVFTLYKVTIDESFIILVPIDKIKPALQIIFKCGQLISLTVHRHFPCGSLLVVSLQGFKSTLENNSCLLASLTQ